MTEKTKKRIPQQPINGQPSGLKIPRGAKPKPTVHHNDMPSKLVIYFCVGLAATVVLCVVWFIFSLSPMGGDSTVLKKITIPNASSSTQIGKELEKQKIIRSAFAFDIYVRLFGKSSVLKAGTYRISPAENTLQIIEHFVKGSVDEFKITFYPGATLENYNQMSSGKMDVTSVLKRAGYSDAEIRMALEKQYDSPLFAGKPSSANLEGYVFGDTYNISDGATVDDILTKSFAEFYNQLQKNNLLTGFKNHNLSLYEAITLASIVQREAGKSNDQRIVAGIFYNRLGIGMSLGSDVTYQYAADKAGVPRDTNLSSPYNTRIVAGLPPGPIASPGLSALKAVANPSNTEYMFFLAGDDGIMHYATTADEHSTNIAKYCKVGCATP